ncbi:ABC transporter permease/substrate-binding protein [Oceanivirga miroungae]|uniref:Glycine betaine ABC transporter substrate-binding protein n=1 Tax=Oceanivirga miroungae TaxID=1130046 RepID=A0A6I8MCN0_9FUSO|nr:ABC transporter permease/substrate-binding protein [Oceanivirga miroungae]VWL84879.1 glycine betaine ABC transporter substrate-binding protein [Oceanivirga miroungae]
MNNLSVTKALLEHIQISLLSLIIAILVALPLAIIISRNKKLSFLFLNITSVMQTIPSLALLGLFIPILGIGIVPAVTALVIYAIFPILQNTITALNEIDPYLEEAADAFGMTRFEKLKKFELALAMPVIMAGIRTSAVMIIGTATLAALIAAGGLGSFILLGIDRNNGTLILIGAVLSALLAIIFNFAIKILEKTKIKYIFLTFIITTFALIISLLPSTIMGNDKIIIASKFGAEPEIIMNMYKELIEANTDLEVELKPHFGKTVFLYEALKSKDIDIYTEYTGTVLTSLVKTDASEISTDSEEVYNLAKQKLYDNDKLVLLKPMQFQNTYALTLKKDFANKYNLKNISDLKKVENLVTAGFTLEFNDREDGYPGIKKLYGINLKVKTMEPALRYTAILAGDIDMMDAYSTDSEIKRYNLVGLKDDKHLFPPYQASPLLREDLIIKYPIIKDVLEKLSGLITEEEMIQMNYDVDVNKKDANTVAKDFLIKNHLLEK